MVHNVLQPAFEARVEERGEIARGGSVTALVKVFAYLLHLA
jgi:hypothetical protein